MSQKFLNPIVVDGQVTAEYLDLSTTTSHSVNAGEIAWNAVDGTFDVGMLNGVTLQEGQEIYFYAKATEAILNGQAVMFAGVQGDHLLISKAERSVLNANPNYFMGVATQDFATNDFGYVTAFGKVRELDTTAYTLGAILYYDSTSATPGLLTDIMPSANQAKIEAAAVVRVHATQGILMVRPHIMPMLNQIQDVDVTLSKTTPIDADSVLLQDSADQSIWKKLSWSNVKATLKTYFDTLYQKGTGTTNYVPKFTGANTLGDSQIFDNGTNVGIGTTSPSAKTAIHKSESGSNPSAVLRLENTGANYTSKLILTDGTTNDANISYLGATQSLGFGIGSSLNQMVLNSTGNVGIGTINPTAKLHISDAKTGTKLIIEDSYGGSGKWGLGAGIVGLNDTHFTIKHENTSTIVLTATPSGNIGIGTTTPEDCALLELESITKGFLPPRMRTGDRNGITSPVPGLMIFNEETETIDVFTSLLGWRSLLF